MIRYNHLMEERKTPAAQDTVRETIIEYLQSQGVRLFGFNSAALMVNEAPGHRPDDLLPGATSLIGFALPLPQGVYSAPRYRTETVWRSQNLLYRELDTIALRLAGMIEEHGFRALPNFGCCPMDMNEKGDVIGFINQIKIGEGVRIGFIGKNGLLVNSLYGSRMMLGSVITTADTGKYLSLETEENGCPEDCEKCVAACPVRAVSTERKKVDIMPCLCTTAKIPSLPVWRFLFWRKISPSRAAVLMNRSSFDEHTMHTCSRCVSTCPLGTVEKQWA
jgi:epoxyqueuosine reductase QueG